MGIGADNQTCLTDEQRLLLAESSIPKNLQNQVKDSLRGQGRNGLLLRGSDVNRRVANYIVAFLDLCRHHKLSQYVTCLEIEREIEDEEAINIMASFLRERKDEQRQQLDSLKIMFAQFGTSRNARDNCRSLFSAKQNWRSLDLRHCNFTYDGAMERPDLSYITQGLAAQQSLQEFSLCHGLESGVRAMGDAELATLLNVLCAKKQTLRTLLMRDRCQSAAPHVIGHATTHALIDLLESRDRCPHQLDCQLQKLVWDIPCTHELYREGSILQRRFLSALSRNETLVSVQLRRISIRTPLAQTVQAFTRRNQKIGRVRTALRARPAWGLWAPLLAKLVEAEERSQSLASSAIYLALTAAVADRVGLDA